MLRNELDNSSIAVTLDLWKGLTTVNYLGLTGHWLNEKFELRAAILSLVEFNCEKTAENLQKMLQAKLVEWDIEGKVSAFNILTVNWLTQSQLSAIVTDNASNNLKAFKDKLHIPCAAHTVQLSVTAALKRIEPLLIHCRKIAEHFHRSHEAVKCLKGFQIAHNLSERVVPTDVVTRWNSTYELMEFLVVNQVPLEEALRRFDWPSFTVQEWSTLKELIQVLEIPALITEQLSGAQYVTLSLVYPMIRQWQTSLDQIEATQPITKQIIAAMQEDLKERWSPKTSTQLCMIASFLDPRFKKLVFATSSERQALHREIVELMVDPLAVKPKVKIPTQKQTKQSKILKFLSTGEEEEKQVNSPELDLYLSEPVQCHNGDPLTWWRANRDRYPELSRLARIFLAIPATSVPSEQLFSTAGDVLTKKRNRLASDSMEAQVFVYKNYDLINDQSHQQWTIYHDIITKIINIMEVGFCHDSHH